MSHSTDVGAVPLRPDDSGPWSGIRWVCTKNPFYVLSALCFLLGLWISFGGSGEDVDNWALMSGLAGYTLLLAVTACLLVRFGNVWDDVRTVLLLVVLMFLATSVTFDELLVLTPARGVVFYLGGLLFTIAVSEGLLRGTRLRLPALFRGPYYLILALFFLYPLALRPFVHDPHGEAVQWGLFGFTPAAGLVFLTLLPAIRRGPAYVRDNGSPWPWPLYPWVLFGVLALAVPARSFLLCWSMHLLPASSFDRLIFGLYFLVPFGLAIAVLVMEIGLVAKARAVVWTALAMPAGLVALTLAGHRHDPIYQGFLEVFVVRLGGDPVYVTVLASVGFYAYAVLRRASAATEALTGALMLLAVVGPDTLTRGELTLPQPAPLLVATALQLLLGLRRRDSWRFMLAGGLMAFAAIGMPGGTAMSPVRGAIAFHLILLTVLVVGAVFDDEFARMLRAVGVTLALLASLAVMISPFDPRMGLPPWALQVYPLALAVVLAGYGLLLHYRPALVVAALVPACWLVLLGARAYAVLRQLVIGLDYLALSLGLFALAILSSLVKSRWQRGKAHSTS